MKRRKPSLDLRKGIVGRFRGTSGMKRNAGRESKKAVGKVPNDILVQRMSSAVSGRLRKYEPLDTKDFVSFEDYEELSVENIKEACEKFYNASPGSCDILASDSGTSCMKLEQIKGRKVYFIRFLPPNENAERIFRPKKLKDLRSLQTARDQPQFRHPSVQVEI